MVRRQLPLALLPVHPRLVASLGQHRGHEHVVDAESVPLLESQHAVVPPGERAGPYIVEPKRVHQA